MPDKNNKISRRTFCKLALLATACSLPQAKETILFKGKKNVVVIGAGIAGLAAAREIRQKGHTVTILEARTRIGGRIWSDRSLGVIADLGASWIHGVDGNPITKLAREFNAKTAYTDYEDIALFYPSGELAEEEQIERYDGRFFRALAKLPAIAEDLDDDISLATAIQRAFANKRASDKERLFWQWRRSVMELDTAEDFAKLSL